MLPISVRMSQCVFFVGLHLNGMKSAERKQVKVGQHMKSSSKSASSPLAVNHRCGGQGPLDETKTAQRSERKTTGSPRRPRK